MLRKKKKNDASSPESPKEEESEKKPRKRRQYKDRATRRREILEAAETLFLARGFLATGVKDIAKAVGVSYGVFYHHFPTKRDILFAFVNLRLERAEKLVAEWAKDADMTAINKMEKILDMVDDGHRFRVSMDYLRSGEPREDPELYDAFTSMALPRLTELIAEIVEEGIKKEGFQVESPRGFAILFYTMSLDIIHRAATVDKLVERKKMRLVYRISVARMLGLASDTFLGDR